MYTVGMDVRRKAGEFNSLVRAFVIFGLVNSFYFHDMIPGNGIVSPVEILKILDVTEEYKKKCGENIIGLRPVYLCVISEFPLQAFCLRELPREKYIRRGNLVMGQTSGQCRDVLEFSPDRLYNDK